MPYDPDKNVVEVLSSPGGREVSLILGDGRNAGMLAYCMNGLGNKVMALILEDSLERSPELDRNFLVALDKRYDEYVRIAEDRLGKLKKLGAVNLTTPAGREVVVEHSPHVWDGAVIYRCQPDTAEGAPITVVIADDFYQSRPYDYDEGVLKILDERFVSKEV